VHLLKTDNLMLFYKPLINSAKFYVIIEDYQKAFDILKKDYKLFPTKEAAMLLQKLKEEKLR